MHVHIIFSSIHAQTPRVFEYLKRAGRANFGVYLKNIVSKRQNQYSPIKPALSPFLSLFLSLESFFPIFSLVKKQQRPVRV